MALYLSAWAFRPVSVYFVIPISISLTRSLIPKAAIFSTALVIISLLGCPVV